MASQRTEDGVTVIRSCSDTQVSGACPAITSDPFKDRASHSCALDERGECWELSQRSRLPATAGMNGFPPLPVEEGAERLGTPRVLGCWGELQDPRWWGRAHTPTSAAFGWGKSSNFPLPSSPSAGLGGGHRGGKCLSTSPRLFVYTNIPVQTLICRDTQAGLWLSDFSWESHPF